MHYLDVISKIVEEYYNVLQQNRFLGKNDMLLEIIKTIKTNGIYTILHKAMMLPIILNFTTSVIVIFLFSYHNFKI